MLVQIIIFEHLKTLIDEMNGVDIFIYNAGYGEPSATLNPEIERNVYEINVKGFVDLTAYMFNFFVQQGSWTYCRNVFRCICKRS